MKAVIQRVSEAAVKVEGECVGEIRHGYLIYLAVHREDGEKDLQWLLNRILKTKLFEDEEGKMGASLGEVQGEVLLVSQFTLYGTMTKGTKPSFSQSAPGEEARAWYEAFLENLREAYKGKVATGVFAADMQVHSTNEGPVTLVLDSRYPKG